MALADSGVMQEVETLYAGGPPRGPLLDQIMPRKETLRAASLNKASGAGTLTRTLECQCAPAGTWTPLEVRPYPTGTLLMRA